MELDFTDKTVVLTDGESNLGSATAFGFAREGCNLAVCCRTKEAAKYLSEKLGAMGCKNMVEGVNITDSREMGAFVDRISKEFGSIHVWVNNAEINLSRRMMEISIEDFDVIFNNNLKSMFFASQCAMRQMIESKIKGVIIKLSAYCAMIPFLPEGLYSASKAGIGSLTRSFAAMCAPYGIRVAALAPEEAMMPNQGMTAGKADVKRRLGQIALQRLCTPEEIADILIFLASDRCSYITGCTIEASGGKLCVQNPAAAWIE